MLISQPLKSPKADIKILFQSYSLNNESCSFRVSDKFTRMSPFNRSIYMRATFQNQQTKDCRQQYFNGIIWNQQFVVTNIHSLVFHTKSFDQDYLLVKLDYLKKNQKTGQWCSIRLPTQQSRIRSNKIIKLTQILKLHYKDKQKYQFWQLQQKAEQFYSKDIIVLQLAQKLENVVVPIEIQNIPQEINQEYFYALCIQLTYQQYQRDNQLITRPFYSLHCKSNKQEKVQKLNECLTYQFSVSTVNNGCPLFIIEEDNFKCVGIHCGALGNKGIGLFLKGQEKDIQEQIQEIINTQNSQQDKLIFYQPQPVVLPAQTVFAQLSPNRWEWKEQFLRDVNALQAKEDQRKLFIKQSHLIQNSQEGNQNFEEMKNKKRLPQQSHEIMDIVIQQSVDTTSIRKRELK